MNKPYTAEQQKDAVDRIEEYAGADMETRLRNPRITKRQAIMLADYIEGLKGRIRELEEVVKKESSAMRMGPVRFDIPTVSHVNLLDDTSRRTVVETYNKVISEVKEKIAKWMIEHNLHPNDHRIFNQPQGDAIIMWGEREVEGRLRGEVVTPKFIITSYIESGNLYVEAHVYEHK